MRETLHPVGVRRSADASMPVGARSREPAGRWIALASASLATAVCVSTFVAAARFAVDRIGSLEHRLPIPVAALALVAMTPVVTAVWALRTHRPVASSGLSVAVIATVVPLWAAWSWLGASVRAAVLAVFPVAVVGLLLVVVGWTDRPKGNRTLRRASILLATSAALTHLLGYDAFTDPGCARTCERVTPLLEGVLSTRSVVALACSLTVAAAIAAAAAILRGRGPRTPALVVGAASVALGGLAAASAVRWATWGDAATWSVVLLLQPILVAMVAAVICVVEGRSWRTRAAVARVIARLSAPEGRLPALGGSIHDVHFAVPGMDRWVDAAGDDVGAPSASTKHVVLFHDAVPVLRLVLARGADEGDVIATLTPASRLALRNAQLSAVTLARLLDVRASQRRVVAAADVERRRIERDLHDGAQQRLIGVCFQLNIARARVDAATAAMLQGAERRVRDALARLREIAHGMFPRVLADEGIEAALEDLVSESPVAATLDVRLGDPVNPEVALAAYATVVAVLRHAPTAAGSARARVSLERIDDDLVVRTEIDATDATTPDLTQVADRVGAAGGRLSVSTTPAGGVSVSAVIPCAS